MDSLKLLQNQYSSDSSDGEETCNSVHVTATVCVASYGNENGRAPQREDGLQSEGSEIRAPVPAIDVNSHEESEGSKVRAPVPATDVNSHEVAPDGVVSTAVGLLVSSMTSANDGLQSEGSEIRAPVPAIDVNLHEESEGSKVRAPVPATVVNSHEVAPDGVVSTAVGLLVSSLTSANVVHHDENLSDSVSVKCKVDMYQGMKFAEKLHKFVKSEQEFVRFGADGGLQFCSPEQFRLFKGEFDKSDSDRNFPSWFPENYKNFRQSLYYNKFREQKVQSSSAGVGTSSAVAAPPAGPLFQWLKKKFDADTVFDHKDKKGKGKQSDKKK